MPVLNDQASAYISKREVNQGALIGGIVGGLLGFLLIIILAAVLSKRR
jgi:hypothetical protein